MKKSSLFGNRDYALLWFGQTFSLIGSSSSWIAYPLLVLALTGSPSRAGVVGSAAWLPYLVFQLPAGALVERWNRKWTMAVCDAVRLLVLATVSLLVAVDRVSFWEIVVAAFVERSATIFFQPAEDAALSRIVPPAEIAQAVARNDARENTAGVIGPAIGGALFSVARLAPFAVDAISYLGSLLTVVSLQTPLAVKPTTERKSLRHDIREGLTFLWRVPFLRSSALQVLGTNITWSALVLALIVVERGHGASGAAIGVMLALFSFGGVVGSLASGFLLRRLTAPVVVIGAVWWWATITGILIFSTNAFLSGALGGAALFLAPTWNGAVVGLRMRLTPDHLQARVSAVEGMLSFAGRPPTILATGFLLQAAGGKTTLAAIAIWTTAIAVLSTVAPSLRNPPQVPTTSDSDARLEHQALSA